MRSARLSSMKLGLATGSIDRCDAKLRGGTGNFQFHLLPLLPSHELLAEWGLRRDDQHFIPILNNLRASAARTDEIDRTLTLRFRSHQRSNIDLISSRELAPG